MNNPSSYCGLVDARISASDKDLPVQYMKTTSSEHVVYINCFECQNKNKKQFIHTPCSELAVFMYRTGESMNDLL